MHMLRRATMLVAAMFVLGGCGGASLASVAASHSGQRAAIVSLAANEYGRLHGWEEMRDGAFMAERAAEMLQLAEGQLGTRWQVIPSSVFASDPEFVALAGPVLPVTTPVLGAQRMPTLAQSPGTLAQGRIPPETAQALARVTGADLVVLVYAELSTATGKWSFTTKPVTKTVLTIYDAAGNRLYYGRRDVMADQVVGGGGHAGFNEETAQLWIDAFASGLAQLFAG